MTFSDVIFQETHFPYNSSLASLLCDKPENRQGQDSRSPGEKMKNGDVVRDNNIDVRALSPSDTTVPPFSPEPLSTVSTVTLRADTSHTLLDQDTTDLISESDRTISACSTLEGDDEILSDSESPL